MLDKLDGFKRKYYRNQIIKGAIYSVTWVTAMYLAAVLLEYFGQFGTTARTTLFYLFILGAMYLLGVFIVRPLAGLYQLGKSMTYEDAAKIIGDHFTDVQDRLLNVLQLNEMGRGRDRELLLASIDQKSDQLKPVPFSSAIDHRENLKHLRIAIIPLLLIGALAVYNADIFSSGTDRLIHHRTEFIPKAPFEFQIQNENLKAFKNQDFELHVKLQGEWIPDKVYIEQAGKRFKLKKKNKSEYTYKFRNLREKTAFNLTANGYNSKEYMLNVVPLPVLSSFRVKLDYPAYTGKQAEERQNAGDLEIPAGTKVTWMFNTEDVGRAEMVFNDEPEALKPSAENQYTVSKRVLQSSPYTLVLSNSFVPQADSIRYALSVRPDLYPSIEVEEGKDSLAPKQIFFKGFIQDDYGLRQLKFHYAVKDEQGNEKVSSTDKLPFTQGSTQDQFFHAFDLNTLELAPGDKVTYYFEVWDNDAVNGSKSAKTYERVFEVPSIDEVNANAEKKNEEIKTDLSHSIDKAKEIQEGLKRMQEKMLEKKQMTWEDKAALEELQKQHEELKKQLKDLNQKTEQNLQNQKEFNPEISESILQKQQELQKLFEELMNPEMEKLMQEMQRLMDKMDKRELQEAMEDMELKNEDLEKELDRSLELFKQMEFEQKLENIKNKMDKMAEQQEKLSEQAQDKKENLEDLKKKQEDLDKKFDDVKKELDDLKKLNESLENKNKMEDMSEEKKDVDSNMDQSQEQLNKNNRNKASQMQKKASESMKSMAEKMAQMQSAMSSQQSGEDLDNLRKILENTIKLSFDQEALMGQLDGISRNDPKYVAVAQEQRKIKDGAQIVKDSLYALSKRVPQISSTVNKEISAINRNMEKVLTAMTERRTSVAASRQQYVMTSLNNLALLLDEAVQQLQKQMQQQKGGKPSSNCKKPGSKPGESNSMKSMKQMQQQLNKQIEALKKALEDGKQPGKKGEKQGQIPGAGQMSKEIAQMAARQQALRQKIREMEGKLQKEGKGDAVKSLKDIQKKMEETEKDLVNRNISRETIRRQQEIMTRLLEAEKAERQQDWDKKREAVEAKNQEFSNPSDYFEYNSLKNKETEFLRTVPVNYKVFYRKKASEYFNSN